MVCDDTNQDSESSIFNFESSINMLHQTQGIVLKTIKYGETSVISKVYTEKFGLQSYIINGIRSSKSKSKSGLLQVFSLLDMIVYHGVHKNLQRVKEFKSAFVFSSLPFDMLKISVGLFAIEVMNKCIKEEEKNKVLFDFLFEFIHSLDQIPSNSLANLPIYFLLHFSKYLGFGPGNNFTESKNVFDLKEGLFTERQPGHSYYLQAPFSEFISQLLSCKLETSATVRINKDQRKVLTEAFLKYYQLHIDSFHQVKSYTILAEVLAGSQ